MRYIILVLLNIPVILLALMNLITKYKTGRISNRRFKVQILFWLLILAIVIISFPSYNYIVGNPVFVSNKLTLLDIVQTTAIVYLLYSINSQRQKLEWTEKRMRDLHQELSIRLSEK